MPPSKGPRATARALPRAACPFSRAELAAYVARSCPEYVCADFQGQNKRLKAEAHAGPALEVATGCAADIPAAALFGEQFVVPHSCGPDPDQPSAFSLQPSAFLASISSVHALALRVLVDLSGLKTGETLWVLDPTVPQAFGPYAAADAVAEGRWLPTTLGDRVVLMLRSGGSDLPALRLTGLSHFYTGFEKDLDPNFTCPINVDCETDPDFQKVSTGIAMIIIPSGTYGHVQCTGALINNADTAALEPYLITANHCFEGSPNAAQIDVIWDYRAVGCPGGDAPDQDDPELPHSAGEEILALDADLDGAFLRLADVPIGTLGRAWLGWDTYTPSDLNTDPSNIVACIHHPAGAAMKICKGHVTEVDMSGCLDVWCFDQTQHQTEINWDHGITEGGSSGSPLLYYNRNFRILGMLSSGAVHDCNNPSQNIDNFVSFPHFYRKIACHLKTDGVCEPSDSSDDCWCPLASIFGKDAKVTENLRIFRDKALMKTAWGRRLTRTYYAAAPAMLKAVTASEALRAVFVAGATPFAVVGACLD